MAVCSRKSRHTFVSVTPQIIETSSLLFGEVSTIWGLGYLGTTVQYSVLAVPGLKEFSRRAAIWLNRSFRAFRHR